jgi:hypothetical protein
MLAAALIGLIPILLAWRVDAAIAALLGRSKEMIGVQGVLVLFLVFVLPGILVGPI